MQKLVDTIRAKANNIVSPEGLGYSSNLSGVGVLKADSNLLYQLHLYPAQWQSAANGDALAQAVAGHPIYVGEFGTPFGADDLAANDNGAPHQGATQWTKDMLSWLEQHQYSWTAWSLITPYADNHTAPSLISDWNYTPTPYFGAVVKDNLTNHAVLNSLATALQYATSEYNYALATNSPSLALAEGSYSSSSVAYNAALRALNTQSTGDWITAEQYAVLALTYANADAASGNPFGAAAAVYDTIGYTQAESAPFYVSV
jgi:hypothetical protein